MPMPKSPIPSLQIFSLQIPSLQVPGSITQLLMFEASAVLPGQDRGMMTLPPQKRPFYASSMQRAFSVLSFLKYAHAEK